MSKSEAASALADLEALTALQADAQELEWIDNLLGQFNIFEAIGFVHQETQHSRFLAFLLDPRQNHRLDDRFLRGFLHEALKAADGVTFPLYPSYSHDGALNKTMVYTRSHADPSPKRLRQALNSYPACTS